MMNRKNTIARLSAIALAMTLAACESTAPAQNNGGQTSDIDSSSTINDNEATSIGIGSNGGLTSEIVDERDSTGAGNGLNSSAMDDGAGDMAGDMQTVFYFDFDKSTLSLDVRNALDAHASKLIRSGASVVLEGHADERGTREYNMALGERRAKAVAAYLKVKGVMASKIEMISFGEEKPAVEGSTEASWAKNRRVELK